MEKVQIEFEKEKEKREEFEENIFNVLEDTLSKLETDNIDY
jgi:hypothetical protein